MHGAVQHIERLVFVLMEVPGLCRARGQPQQQQIQPPAGSRAVQHLGQHLAVVPDPVHWAAQFVHGLLLPLLSLPVLCGRP
jgi:hypothetical protein